MLVTCTAIALVGWLVQVGADAGDVRAGRSAPDGADRGDRVRRRARRPPHRARGGRDLPPGRATARSGSRSRSTTPNDVPGSDGAFRIFAYNDELPAYVLLPALVILLSLVALGALYAGFAAARGGRRADRSPWPPPGARSPARRGRSRWRSRCCSPAVCSTATPPTARCSASSCSAARCSAPPAARSRRQAADRARGACDGRLADAHAGQGLGMSDKQRWEGIERPYDAEDVERLQGSVQVEHTLAQRGAEKLWELPERPSVRRRARRAAPATRPCSRSAPASRRSTSSGWQVAADANLARQMYPDQGLYPVNSVPEVVRGDQRRAAAGRPDRPRRRQGRDRLARPDRRRHGGRLRRPPQRLRAHEGDDRGRRRRRAPRGPARVGEEVRPHGRQGAAADRLAHPQPRRRAPRRRRHPARPR